MKRRALGFNSHIFLAAISYLILVSCPSLQAQQKLMLKGVNVEGNIRVEADAVRLHLKARPGDPYDPEVVSQDVKAIYRMGFFDDVKADLSPDGVLIYLVKEKPYIREVKFQGYDKISEDKIKTAFAISPRTILDRDKISEGVEKVKKIYSDQGYVNAQVEPAVSIVENNQAIVQVAINEGRRLLIQKISFQGNHAFSESELKGLMSTKAEWFLSFITNRGVLEHDVLTNDLAVLSSHYYDDGYINHKIDEPVILRRKDGIEVVIRIQEGEQYKVGKVEIGGELLDDGQSLLKKVQMTTGQIFRGSRLRADITALTDFYSDKGFAFVQIDPVTKVNPEEKTVDIALIIARGPPVYFNRVVVAGNTKTRDKVIRRELTAGEQTLFSGNKIKQSRDALQRTGYFEDVQLTTKKTDQPDSVDLLVDVREGPTGSFNIGAGYSSGDKFVFNTSVGEKNLFGLGQALSASFVLGSTRQDFVLSFTEPYLYDTPLSLGFDVYNSRRDYTDSSGNTSFTSQSSGFSTRTSYPLRRLELPFWRTPVNDPFSERSEWSYAPIIQYTRVGMNYDLVRNKIFHVDPTAPSDIQDEKGSSWTSALTPILTYDSRDHFFNPTEGTYSNLSMKFAGLGGDNRFLKNDVMVRWYHPLLKDPKWGGTYAVGIGGTLGYGIGFIRRADGQKDLPLFERYFPGGINSVRGFKDRSLGPQQDGNVIGGDKQAIANFELLFPIYEQYGLRGVAFFDMGQAFGASQSISFGDFRRSVGFGGRWLSPFGPIRVELGFPLNKQPGDQTSVLGFSFGNQP